MLSTMVGIVFIVQSLASFSLHDLGKIFPAWNRTVTIRKQKYFKIINLHKQQARSCIHKSQGDSNTLSKNE